jgi:hypothetical protein
MCWQCPVLNDDPKTYTDCFLDFFGVNRKGRDRNGLDPEEAADVLGQQVEWWAQLADGKSPTILCVQATTERFLSGNSTKKLLARS